MENCHTNHTNYQGLIFNCPFDGELDNCNYKQIRRFTIKKRLAYYDALAEQEKMTLIEKHLQCLSAREKKTLFYESQ